MFKIVVRGNPGCQSVEELEKCVTKMMQEGWRVHSVGRWEGPQSFWVALVKGPEPVAPSL
jgi:hypothetical protein